MLRGRCSYLEVNVGMEGSGEGMQPEDLETGGSVRGRNILHDVEAAGPQQSRVNRPDPIGCSQHHHPCCPNSVALCSLQLCGTLSS